MLHQTGAAFWNGYLNKYANVSAEMHILPTLEYIDLQETNCTFFFLWFSESLKQEPQDDDFSAKNKGVKRKRIKDEPMDGSSDFTNSPE